MTLPGFEPARRIDRNIWRRIFLTSQISSSFGGPTMDVKAEIAASNLAAMSYVEVISASVVECWPLVIKKELTTYLKERHEHGINYVSGYRCNKNIGALLCQ